MDNYSVNSYFPSDEFALLLFSHLKLLNIDTVDIEELNYVLTDLYNLDEYSYFLKGYVLRKTDTKKASRRELIEIDTLLMNAYLLGYLDQKDKKILLSKEYIEEFVVPKYGKEVNEIIKRISKRYIECIKMDYMKKPSNKNFLYDLLERYPSFSRNRKKKDDYEE